MQCEATTEYSRKIRVKAMIRTCTELFSLKTFDERVKYLMLNGKVAESTFGYDRYLNQQFYRSPEWRRIRREIILRDDGCDLGCKDHPIKGHIYVHHLNPITRDDIIQKTPYLLDPEYLITISYNTHQAVTFGTETSLPKPVVERTPNDTCPWK